MATKLIPLKATEHLMKSEKDTIDGNTFGIKDFSIVINKTISLNDAMMFVRNVVDNVVSEDGEYLPLLKDFIIDMQILTGFANFKMPSDVSKQYIFVTENQHIVRAIKEVIDKDQLNSLCVAVEDGIRHKLRIAESSLSTQMNNLAYRMNDFSNYAKDIFGEMSGEDFTSILSATNKINDIDEESLIKGIVEAEVEH